MVTWITHACYNFFVLMAKGRPIDWFFCAHVWQGLQYVFVSQLVLLRRVLERDPAANLVVDFPVEVGN